MNQTTNKSSSQSLPWKRATLKHQNPVLRKSIWQLTNSLVPYLALWGVMIWSLDVSYWLTLGLAVVAAGFLARIFMIFHDCAHGSFMKSNSANRLLELATGVLTFTPYRQWRHQHALHHANSGNLDGRGAGAIWTMTVEEYMSASRWKRMGYRLFRSPLFLFVLLPPYLFLVHNRIPARSLSKHHRRGVHLTNATILGVVILMSLTVGIKPYLLIQLPIITIAGIAGIWLFYVQHQFEGVSWERRQNFDFASAALRGSSYYQLPRILQWFTANIGFHHIHHLCPAIPNYSLEKCHRENLMFQQAKPLTLYSSMRSLSLRLWDERRGKLVGFGHIRSIRRGNP